MSMFSRLDEVQERSKHGKLVSGDKVAGFYEVLVRTWSPKSDVLALAYGTQTLGLFAAASGAYGNMYFRKKLRLRQFGFVTTYFPNTVLPFLIVNAFQSAGILRSVYLDPHGCSLCKEFKAAGIQVGFGLLQPLLLVPASSFMFATRHFTYRIPSPYYNRKDFIKFVLQLYRPLKGPMTVNVCIQIAAAIFITNMQLKEFIHLQSEMVKPRETENETQEQ